MIPLGFLLIPFGVAAAAVLGYGFLVMFALYRFGGTFSSFAATFLFWAGCAGALFFAWYALAGVDWTQPLLDSSSFFSAPTL